MRPTILASIFAAAAMVGGSAGAQTTTFNCIRLGYSVNCSSSTAPAAPSYEGPMNAFAQTLGWRLGQYLAHRQQVAAANVQQAQPSPPETEQAAAARAELQVFIQDPRHPYFFQAKDTMASLLMAGRAHNLQDAYDLAIVELGLVH